MSELTADTSDAFKRQLERANQLEAENAELAEKVREYKCEWESACNRERGRMEEIKDLKAENASLKETIEIMKNPKLVKKIESGMKGVEGKIEWICNHHGYRVCGECAEKTIAELKKNIATMTAINDANGVDMIKLRTLAERMAGALDNANQCIRTGRYIGCIRTGFYIGWKTIEWEKCITFNEQSLSEWEAWEKDK